MAGTKSNNQAGGTRIGKLGEQAAQTLLEACGYVMVDVNVRPRGDGDEDGYRVGGELDVVAWDGSTLCFVEVKTRRGVPDRTFPVEAVDMAKQRQIARLATLYAAQSGLLSGEMEVPFRFDVVAVYMTREEPPTVQHIQLFQGAFLAPDNVE